MRTNHFKKHSKYMLLLVVLVALVATGCGDGEDESVVVTAAPVVVVTPTPNSFVVGGCTQDTPGMEAVYPGTDRKTVLDGNDPETFCLVHGGGVVGSVITVTIGSWTESFESSNCNYANNTGICGWYNDALPPGTIVTCTSCAVGHLFTNPEGEIFSLDGVLHLWMKHIDAPQ